MADGVAKIIQPFPVQSPAEGSVGSSVGQPKFNATHPVGHGVLGVSQLAVDRW
jgi:hypothetical protein